MELYSVWPFEAGFFSCPWDLSKLLCVSIDCSFLLLNCIIWYGWTIVCLTIHPLKDIRVVSSFLLLWIKLVWIFVYRFLCRCRFSLLWMLLCLAIVFNHYFKKNKCIYLWLCWVFVAARGLPLVVSSRGYSSLWCTGFSLQWLLFLQSSGSRCAGFSSCGTGAQ